MALYNRCKFSKTNFKVALLSTSISISLSSVAFNANAFQVDVENRDLSIRLDSNLKYSNAWRIKNVDEKVASTSTNPNLDDGDRNFDKGLISNRVDLLSELDVAYKNLGFRASAAAWYDSVYTSGNDNDGAGVINSASVGAGDFTSKTTSLHGRKAELLDAFVYGRTDIGDESSLSFRLGKHTLLYGETLFFGGNGIANAQTPIDVIKALSVPSAQFKEFMIPVNQLSTTYQVNPELSLSAYYQSEFTKYRLPASGSYFSFADFLDGGGEQLLTPIGVASRVGDLNADDSGQGGLRLQYKAGDYEYGLYAARYHDKVPQVQFDPVTMTYKLVYPQDIKTYGASVSTVVGETNVAAEISIRQDTPLSPAAGLIVTGDPTADGKYNPAYPMGDSLHLNVSWISVLAASPLWDGAEFLGEIGYNHLSRVTKNRASLDPNTTKNAAAIRMLFTPQFFQLYPGVDLSVPIGLGYGLAGRSAVSNFGGMPEHGGDISIGVTADIRKQWKASANFTHYFGDAGGVLLSDNSALSFDQVYKDRDFISFSVQTAF